MLKVLLSVLLVCKTIEAIISVPLTSPARYLVSNAATGRVYVSTGPTVYRLSQDLKQLDAINVGANQNEMSGMALTDNGNWLVICLKSNSCSVVDARSALSASLAKSEENAIAGGTEGAVVFTDSKSTFYTGGVGAGDNRHVFAQLGFAGSAVSRLSDEFLATGSRVMYGGFYHSPYAYYVAVDERDEIRIIRVCDESAIETNDFNAVYELELECGNTSVDHLVGVSLVNNVTLVLGAVHSRSSNTRGAVCSYNLSAINAAMDRFFNDCLVGSESFSNNVDVYSGSVYDSLCSEYDKPVSVHYTSLH